MINKIRKRMAGEGGFTLIELLVVIIIIAILAAIAIPTFLGQQQKAKDAAAKALVRNAMTAMESLYVDTKNFTNMAEASLEEIEPSINFVAAPGTDAFDPDPASGPQTSLNQVGYDGTVNSYEVGSVSGSGRTFGVRVDKAVGGGVDWYIDGAVSTW